METNLEQHLPQKLSEFMDNLGNIVEGWYAIFKTHTDTTLQIQGFSGHIVYITNHDGITDSDYPDWIDEDDPLLTIVLLVEDKLKIENIVSE